MQTQKWKSEKTRFELVARLWRALVIIANKRRARRVSSSNKHPSSRARALDQRGNSGVCLLSRAQVANCINRARLRRFSQKQPYAELFEAKVRARRFCEQFKLAGPLFAHVSRGFARSLREASRIGRGQGVP